MALTQKYTVGVRLDGEDIKTLDRIAAAEDRTVSAVVRRIIVEWLAKQPKPAA